MKYCFEVFAANAPKRDYAYPFERVLLGLYIRTPGQDGYVSVLQQIEKSRVYLFTMRLDPPHPVGDPPQADHAYSHGASPPHQRAVELNELRYMLLSP